jgi:hypothetical protein
LWRREGRARGKRFRARACAPETKGGKVCRFLHITVNQLARSALGFASVAEKLAFKTVELVRGSEEAVASVAANHDARSLRINLDDVAVRHGP